MASFQIHKGAGEDWTCVKVNEDGQYCIVATGVYEAFTAANWSTYLYTAVEDAVQGYIYTFTLGTMTDGVYTFRLYNSAAPLVGDDPYSEFSRRVVSDTIVSEYPIVNASGQVEASNVRGTNINIVSPRRRR
jgi:hypothetical protein